MHVVNRFLGSISGTIINFSLKCTSLWRSTILEAFLVRIQICIVLIDQISGALKRYICTVEVMHKITSFLTDIDFLIIHIYRVLEMHSRSDTIMLVIVYYTSSDALSLCFHVLFLIILFITVLLIARSWTTDANICLCACSGVRHFQKN